MKLSLHPRLRPLPPATGATLPTETRMFNDACAGLSGQTFLYLAVQEIKRRKMPSELLGNLENAIGGLAWEAGRKETE